MAEAVGFRSVNVTFDLGFLLTAGKGDLEV